ncbi:hypothetical protein GCM10009616_03410 [Microlunatus lacustris]
MATWEDGPEYAPVERPAEFTSPGAAPLETAPPHVQPAAGAPVERPQFDHPSAPVAPLAALVPVVEDVRDPEQPFTVVSSNLTSGSAWGSAHGGPPGTALAPQALPAPALVAPAPAPPGFPAPGTPQWFGPGPYGEQPATSRVDARQVLAAATPGLLAVLGLGAIIFILAPVMVAVAFALRSRVRAAQQQVRTTLSVALGAVGFFAFVGLGRAPLGFGEWWSFVGVWSLLICWATLITVGALVHRALKRGPVAAPPSYPNPWR